MTSVCVYPTEVVARIAAYSVLVCYTRSGVLCIILLRYYVSREAHVWCTAIIRQYIIIRRADNVSIRFTCTRVARHNETCDLSTDRRRVFFFLSFIHLRDKINVELYLFCDAIHLLV